MVTYIFTALIRSNHDRRKSFQRVFIKIFNSDSVIALSYNAYKNNSIKGCRFGRWGIEDKKLV